MVHFFKQAFDYDHDWATVSKGVWQKYPNPYSGHVVSVDVLDRSIDPETGIIRTERILGCKQSAPKWVVKFLGGSEDAFVREVSFVDPQTSRTTVTSVNLSLSQYMTVLEHITYEPSPVNPLSKTLFRQTAEIQARMGKWKSLGDKLESWSAERFRSNAALGRQGFEHVLRVLCEGQEQKVEA
ncbi:hypothetical protein FS837_002599 [Tulasnella sp. UAMH 9824]|nr:hypothetical protein FS837_002599 [Tulasnella sp. UAMH 9824]